MKSNKLYKSQKIACTAGFIFNFIFFAYAALYSYSFFKTKEPVSLNSEQTKTLETVLDQNFPERNELIGALPYNIVPAQLDIFAESAILIDTTTGSILFEKNADEEIPPASMTKLVEMFVVFQAVENGEVGLDDIVPLPRECWGINMPRDASLMFLAEGQTVTLRELLLGLAIASGNDASIAVANYIAGDMESFVAQMNDIVSSLGLTHTHFVESSGYSELNHTTAREFASFCRVYINRYPQALKDYHSQKVLRYPLEHNLPSYQKYQGDGQAITQYNTNKMLGSLEGCDGLKTGFIYESGYNIALTAVRHGTRFLSVTMRGPGKGSKEGNYYRSKDGSTLMEFAFSSFADFSPEHPIDGFTVPVPGGKNKFVRLIPVENETITVPYITGDSPLQAAQQVRVSVQIPSSILENTECGKQYGEIIYMLDGNILKKIPLAADRTIDKSFFINTFIARGTQFLLSMNF